LMIINQIMPKVASSIKAAGEAQFCQRPCETPFRGEISLLFDFNFTFSGVTSHFQLEISLQSINRTAK